MHKVIETSTSSLSAHRTLTNSQIKMNFFMQEYRVLAFLVACCVCNIPGGHTKSTGKLSRGKRQSKEECTSHNKYWDSTTSSCEFCECPAGLQNTAELCGFGFIVGRYQCVDCLDGTFRRPSDHHSTCRQCTVCSPYATIITNCTRTDDTQCKCEKGSIGEHCVSCQDFPLAKNCSAEDVNTTPALNTVTAPHGGDDSNPNLDRESKSCQKKGVGIHFGGAIAIVFFALFIGLGSGIAISGNPAQGKGYCKHCFKRWRLKVCNANGRTRPPLITQPEQS